MTIKGDTLTIRFSTEKFITKNYFIDTIRKYLQEGEDHFKLVKIKHGNGLYKMAGKQIVFTYKEKEVVQFDHFYDSILSRIAIL